MAPNRGRQRVSAPANRLEAVHAGTAANPAVRGVQRQCADLRRSTRSSPTSPETPGRSRTRLGFVESGYLSSVNRTALLDLARCTRRTHRPRCRRFLAFVGLGSLLLAVTAAGVVAAPELPLRVVARVALPGPSNRFDYTSLDRTTNRLYLAHMDAGELLAFDVRRRRVVKTIPAPGVHGVIAVPEINRVFATATDERQLLTIDSRTGRVLRRAPAGSTRTASPTTRSNDRSSSPTRVAASRPSSTKEDGGSRRSHSVARQATCSTIAAPVGSSSTCRRVTRSP
jgi:hypothetical protein